MSKQVTLENPAPVLVEVDSLQETNASVPIAKVDKHEPIVTRKELWSYYRKLSFM